MFTKIHRLAGLLLTAGVALGLANASTAQERGERGGAKNEVTGTFKSADGKALTITIATTTTPGRGEGRGEAVTMEKTFTLAKDVEVAAGTAVGAGGRSGGVAGTGVFKEIKLSDLADGVKVTLYLSGDQKVVESVVAEGPTVRGILKAFDATKNTLTVQTPGRATRDGGVVAGDAHTYTVAKDAEIAVDDGRGARFSVKEAKLVDVAQGAIVTVRLGVDMKTAQAVLAEGPSHHGTIKVIDAAKRTLTLVVRPARGDDAAEEYALTVASDAVIVLDSGKGKRLSVKLAKLSDIPVGAAATVKMSADQVHIMSLRAEGTSLSGHLKSVDAAKGTIVIAIPKGRDDAEKKTLSVAKDVQVVIDGKAAKLADLKPGDNTNVVLRFALDQQTVQTITSHQAMGR